MHYNIHIYTYILYTQFPHSPIMNHKVVRIKIIETKSKIVLFCLRE